MRWFKHMTFSANDEKLSSLKDAFGLEGYGFWWSVVEIIAAAVDENEKISVTFSAKKWGNSLGISAKKFRTLAEFCANIELFSVKSEGNDITVSMPNILKFRDEYTERKVKKSGQCRDNVRPSRARVPDTDTEADTEYTPPTPSQGEEMCAGDAAPDTSPKKTDAPSKGHPQWSAFLACWQVWPVKQGQEAAWREWMRLHGNGTLAETWAIRDAILRLSAEDSRWQEGMVPKMANWLQGKGWNDEPYQRPETARASPASVKSWLEREDEANFNAALASARAKQESRERGIA